MFTNVNPSITKLVREHFVIVSCTIRGVPD